MTSEILIERPFSVQNHAIMFHIEHASDVEARRKQLSTTALPFEYEVYATYETSGQLEDKKLHELIDTLNPKLRLAKNREFFAMSAEKAYRLLEGYRYHIRQC